MSPILLARECGAQTHRISSAAMPPMRCAIRDGCGAETGILVGWIGERVGMWQAAARIVLWIAVFEREADFEGRLINDHAVINPPA